MNKQLITYTLFLISGLFSCNSLEENIHDDPITITIAEAWNADEVIPHLIAIDSLYAMTNPPTPVVKEIENTEAKKFFREHPFFRMLRLNTDELEGIQRTPFTSSARISDTANVNEAIRITGVLGGLKTKWIPSPYPYAYPFTLIISAPDSKSLILNNADIDRIQYEKGTNLSGLKGLIGVGETEYKLTLFFNNFTFVDKLSDQARNYLFEVKMNNTNYYTAHDLQNIKEEGVLIQHPFSQAEFDSLSIRYPGLIEADH